MFHLNHFYCCCNSYNLVISLDYYCVCLLALFYWLEGWRTYVKDYIFCCEFILSGCVFIAELTTSCLTTVLVWRFYTKFDNFLCCCTWPGGIISDCCCCVCIYNLAFNSLYLSTARCTFTVALFITKFFLFYIYYEWSFISNHN